MSQEVAQGQVRHNRATAAKRLDDGGELVGTDSAVNGLNPCEVQLAEIKKPERRESAC